MVATISMELDGFIHNRTCTFNDSYGFWKAALVLHGTAIKLDQNQFIRIGLSCKASLGAVMKSLLKRQLLYH
jgi:hypothetical protein